MITERFKQTLINLQIPNDKIEAIEMILSKDKGRINSDVIEYGDGSQYYSETYVKQIMNNEYTRGKFDGVREPVIHKAEIMRCPVCESTDRNFTLDDIKKAFFNGGIDLSSDDSDDVQFNKFIKSIKKDK